MENKNWRNTPSEIISGFARPSAERSRRSRRRDSYLQIALDRTKFQRKSGVHDIVVTVNSAHAAPRKITEINLGVQYGL